MERIRMQMKSGAMLSIIVGENAYCTPRDDNGTYTHVECGLWNCKVPESWAEYYDGNAETMDYDVKELAVFGYLPVNLLMDWIRENN